ncbi:MAG: zf-TFIIB domain-containing protein [Gammaproteobacteria bacterium]|nr:zf-TFIIB domain-containing protein [Gammaproteobacteria bacterium]
MEPVSFTGTPVHRCTSCQGLWLGSNEFSRLVKDDWLAGILDESPTKQGVAHDKMTEVKCPVCDNMMHHITDEKQPHILYEQCDKGCGVYFDAGEFKDLAQDTFWDKFKTKKILK